MIIDILKDLSRDNIILSGNINKVASDFLYSYLSKLKIGLQSFKGLVVVITIYDTEESYILIFLVDNSLREALDKTCNFIFLNICKRIMSYMALIAAFFITA